MKRTRTTRRRPTLPALLALVVVLLLAAAAPPRLADRLDRLVNDGDAASAFWGVYVQDLATGEVLYDHNGGKGLVPASNLKILTTATALDALGSDYRYRTTLHLAGVAEGSTLSGDLILEGSGDPTFGSREIRGEDPLRAWAKRLAELGVTRIEGRLIGDDDVFDERPYAEGWDVDFVTTERYAPAVSGLSYRDNLATVRIHAQSAGSTPELDIQPAGYLEVRNRIETHSRRRGQRLRIDRNLGTDALTLTGSLPRGYKGQFELPITNPTAFTLQSFRRHLEAAGIEVDAELVDVDDLDEPLDYAAAEPLLVHFSPPLSEILKEINKESNNFYAEQVFRTFGWGGTTEGGARRVKAFLAEAGVADTDGLSIVDGSGLSRKNLVTPAAMSRLLRHMHGHDEQEAFMATLARGGEPETTLRYRLKGQPVLAKTGSLKFIRTLSGYADGPSGERVTFVVFSNNFTAPSYAITRRIDEIVAALRTSA